jgi:hypothetical protein
MVNFIRIFVFILIVIVIYCFYGCDKLFPDDKLTLERTNYTGNEIKTDGYYYRFTDSGNTIVYFLYKNGIILCAHSYSSHDLNMVEIEMVKLYSETRRQKDGWGIFLIKDSEIEYEIWNAPTGYSLPTIKCKGKIINDSTFHITESYFSDIKKTYYRNEMYHFKQFDNKPDSTNSFIN